MAATTTSSSEPSLKRDVGLWGLTFVSLGSIIGSGWLLGALNAAEVAGPASLLSWVLAGVMLAVLALIHAELGAAYPIAGGTARFPHFAFGSLAGFTAGWVAWLQAVTIAPIEVEASLEYLNNIHWVKSNLNLLHADSTLRPLGLLFALLLMVLFTVINIAGVKFMSESNTVMVVWKTIVPIVTAVVLIILLFHIHNFSAGGGFFESGAHGIFAALPAGVVFALQGFEQAIQMGGEARNPQKDISRAVILAMIIGTLIYILLEISFVGALTPSNIVHNWSNPLGGNGSDFGPYATLATVAGATWLTYTLYIDAFISPAGTGLIYIGTSSRLTYALGRQRTAPTALAKLDRRGVPIVSVILAFVIGLISFLPFPSWQSLVGLVTGATAIMYAFAPVSLTALQLRDPDRDRPYKLPFPAVLAPFGFVSANLIIYWGGFEATWKLLIAIAIGFVLFLVNRMVSSSTDLPVIDWRAAYWIVPWLVGLGVIGYFGRYGAPLSAPMLPNWIDLIVVIVFSLIIFYFAVSLAMETEHVREAVEEEIEEIENEPDLNVA